MLGWHDGPLELRQFGLFVAWTHVHPDRSAPLAGRVRLDVNLVFEVALGRLAGHVYAGALGVELPAVVDAAQATLFVSAEKERRAAVRTEGADDANLAVGVAERDQVFTQNADPRGFAV